MDVARPSVLLSGFWHYTALAQAGIHIRAHTQQSPRRYSHQPRSSMCTPRRKLSSGQSRVRCPINFSLCDSSGLHEEQKRTTPFW